MFAYRDNHLSFLFAEVSQTWNSFVLPLRHWRKPETVLFYSCVIGANLKQFCFALASLTKTWNSFVLLLRHWRKLETVLFYPCVIGANLKQFCFALASLAQWFCKYSCDFFYTVGNRNNNGDRLERDVRDKKLEFVLPIRARKGQKLLLLPDWRSYSKCLKIFLGMLRAWRIEVSEAVT